MREEDVETPERIEDSPSKMREEDVETPEHVEETPSKPNEEDVEAPQSPEENSTTEDGGGEGAVDCDILKRVQIQQTDEERARWLGAEGDQLPAAHTVSQDETCNSRTLKAGTLEKLVENLLTAFGDNGFKYISVFLSTYRAFASTSTVLEFLLDRYGNLEISGSKEVGNQNSPESTTVLSIVIASILQAWLDQCAEDFQEPPDYICLMKVLNYMKRNIPGSDLEKRAQNLLEQFQKEELENDGEVPFSVCCPSVKPGTSPCPGQKASCALTNQEKASAVIQRAMEKHNLESGSAAYELVQIISEDKELVIPPKANVFYTMNTRGNLDFILRRKAAAEEEPGVNVF
ncbi:hypothetical protein Q9233_012930 [Columba guinea]|nr:hypothetical protein Q9233_012930 [Columba guinea]